MVQTHQSLKILWRMSESKENLVSLATRTKEEQRNIATMGGKASGEARRQKKTMSEMAKYVLSCPLNEQGIARMKRAGCKVDEKNPTMLTAMIVGQVHAAINGSQKSADFIRSLIDGKSADETSAKDFISALNGDSTIGTEDGIIEE